MLRNKIGRNYEKARQEAEAAGAVFELDVDAQPQAVMVTLAAMAKRYGYRAPSNANGSTGRYFFEMLRRRTGKTVN